MYAITQAHAQAQALVFSLIVDLIQKIWNFKPSIPMRKSASRHSPQTCALRKLCPLVRSPSVRPRATLLSTPSTPSSSVPNYHPSTILPNVSSAFQSIYRSDPIASSPSGFSPLYPLDTVSLSAKSLSLGPLVSPTSTSTATSCSIVRPCWCLSWPAILLHPGSQPSELRRSRYCL